MSEISFTNNIVIKIKLFWKQRILHIMLLPAVVLVFLFSYIPIYGIIIAFKKLSIVDGIWKSPWANAYGFEYFIELFTSPAFFQVLRNTIVISILKLTILSLPPVILAIVIDGIKNQKFKRITQTISYLPHFVSWVIISGIIYNFFSSDGVVNQLFLSMGLIDEAKNYLYSSSFYIPLIIVSDFWKEVGWGTILYLGVIATINQELYDAVAIDGGGKWAKILHVTWPALIGIFNIQLILAVGALMAGGSTFEQSIMLGNNVNKDVSQILDTYVLRVGLENGRFEYATAVGVFKSVVNLILLIIANKTADRISGKSLF